MLCLMPNGKYSVKIYFLIYFMKTKQLLLLCTLTGLLGSCESADVKMRNKMEGDWRIRSAVYKRIANPLNADSAVVYQNATIHFENCRKGGCGGWYDFSNGEKVSFFYYNQATENTFFLNLGSKGSENLESLRPLISLNGEWEINWEDEKNITLLGKIAFKDKNGSVNILGTHEAKMWLEK